jgi:hypothetical protein
VVQFVEQIRRVFIQELNLDFFGLEPVVRFIADQQQGQIRDLLFNPAQKTDTGIGAQFPAAGKPCIGHHTKQVWPIALDQLEGRLVGIGHQYLGPRPHLEQAVLLVEALIEHLLGLVHHLLVHAGQKNSCGKGVNLPPG